MLNSQENFQKSLFENKEQKEDLKISSVNGLENQNSEHRKNVLKEHIISFRVRKSLYSVSIMTDI